jgi:hypothetical protein
MASRTIKTGNPIQAMGFMEKEAYPYGTASGKDWAYCRETLSFIRKSEKMRCQVR